MTDAIKVSEREKVTEASACSVTSPETQRVVAALRDADTTLAQVLVRMFAFDAPRDAHEGELDFLGSPGSFVAADGSEGAEWVLMDGSVVRFTQLDGWSAD